VNRPPGAAPVGDAPARCNAEELLQELQTYQTELEMQNDALRESQCALEQSRDRYVDLYDFSPIGYLTLTRSALIAEINLTGAVLLGKERSKLLQRRFVPFVAAEERERWDRQFVAAMRGVARQRLTVMLCRADGTRFHAQLDCLRIGAEHGTPVLRIALADISDAVRRQAELDRATTVAQSAQMEAERANAAKSSFLAAASHDLRQPLSALTIYVNLLKDKRAPEDRALAANMQECIGSLSGLLTDLLDLSKLEAGVVTPSVSDFPLAEVLTSLESVHAPEAQLKGLRLRCVATRCVGRTDPILFKRLLGNFIANAIRYTDRGGVRVGCRLRQGKAWVEVWDSGIGIPADKIGEIFQEFRQLGDNARNRGSGLGLAIVAKTAALLGLEIRVRSRPGRGSVFAVELPAGLRQEIPAPMPVDMVCRPLRIALVDDNAMVREAFAAGLRRSGHQVVAAATGASLRSQLGDRPPDIVVSDYRLAQGETGFDVIAALRAGTSVPLPAILITGDTDPRLMRSMADRGIIVVHKPVDLETLEAYLEDLTCTG
jgi:signal transduction histidine kinase